MAVRLRVAGIFYNQRFDFDALGADKSILGLMNAAKAGLQQEDGGGPPSVGFDFGDNSRPPGSPRSLEFVSHIITVDSFRTLGAKTRPGGRYVLREFRTTTVDGLPVAYAWQYYVLDSQGRPKSKVGSANVSPAELPVGAGFQPYDTFVLTDGDTVVWRQVAILTR